MRFIDLLNLNKNAMLPNAERVRKRVEKRRSAKVTGIVVGASSLAVFALVISAVLLIGKDVVPKPEVFTGAMNIVESVEASSIGEIGMKTNSVLKIITSEDVSASELKARLSFSPAAEYSVRKTDNCNYELRFDSPLEKDSLYNLQAVYNGRIVYRWAFQTERDFSVTNVYPENDSHASLDNPIEITFSHADVTGFEEAFSISPSVEGTFEHYGRTWAFVPTAPMAPATLYTVTLKKEVAGPDEMNLEEDYRFSFTTSRENSYAFMIYQQNEAADTFLVNEAPIAVLSYDQLDVSSASVQVYRLDNSEAYISAYKEYVRNGEISHEIMALAKDLQQSFTVTPALTSNYNSFYSNAAFINYPEPLPLGYYFAEIQIGGRKLYQLLQSTTLSVYTIACNGDYTIWVNDTKTGAPLSGAEISLEGFDSKKSGIKGTATFENAKETLDKRVLTVANGAYPYVVVLNGEAVDSEVKKQNEFYSYISTNSRLYRANDTVKVFGVILPRKSKVKIPSEAELYFDITDKTYTVDVSKKGYFEVEFPLNNTAMSYGSVSLMLEDAYMNSTAFSIADYELPTYQISVSTDKAAYSEGEIVQVTAQATYMDGTPASGITLSSGDGQITGVTDADGCLRGVVVASLYGSEYYYEQNPPELHTVSFMPEDGTDAYCYGSSDFLVFGSKYIMNVGYKEKSFTVTANEIDFNKALSIDRDDLYIGVTDQKQIAGAAADVTLVAEVHEITYNKVPNGTSYDPINKRVIYSWRYEEIDVVVRTFDMNVVDGSCTMEIPEEPDENRNYYVVVRVPDESDHGVVKKYLTSYDYLGYDQQSYNLVATSNLVNIGDSVDLVVRDGSNNEILNSGSVLCVAVAGEILSVFQSDSAHCTIDFDKEYAPGIFIYGAYFDGKHVYSLGHELLEYDLQESLLRIEMEKDQEQYQPGDKVCLNFTVTDKSGEPVSAMLNLSVMDRALYMLTGEFDDPLYQLYSPRCYASTVYTTCSYRDFMLGELPSGEGGGGGEEWRDDFEDTPYFETIYTDSKGKATVSFTLPDSVTEWKVIARAVSGDVQAGIENFSIRSTQDFFAHISMSDSVKTEDDFVVAVKGEGLNVASDANCRFTVGVSDRDGNEIAKLSCESAKSKYAYLNFGRLEKGLYTVYVQAESGVLNDNVIKTVEVTDAQATVWVHDRIQVADSLTLNLVPERGNVTLTVTDEEREFWQLAMARLKSSAGSRVDQVLGNYLASEYYNTGVWMDEAKIDYSIIRSYMDYGGVSLFVDSETSDLKVAAKLAAVVPDFCDRENLNWTFQSYLNNRHAARIDVLTAYFGLAALGEPVLTDLQSIYGSSSDLSAEESIYLALSFAYAGDYKTATCIFDNQLKQYMLDENETAYMMIDGKIDEDLTGCATLLSNRLGMNYSEKLIRTIIERDTEYTLLNLELISYLNDHVSETIGTNTVKISTGDGRSESYTYHKMEPLVLTLSPEQAADIRIVNVEGTSVVSYAYNGDVEDLRQLGERFSMGIELPYEVQVSGKDMIYLHVDVPVDFKSPVLDLTLPAGLRFESGTVTGEKWSYSVFSYYNTDVIHAPLMHGSNTVAIQVRGALPGNYTLEPIVVSNASDGRFMATDPSVITVTAGSAVEYSAEKPVQEQESA